MFDDLDVFAAVVEHSSLNRASRQLNLSQPALSRKISKLEERLGVALFNRYGKRLELTEVGRLTYSYALEQRQQRSKFLEALSKYKEGEPKLVTLGRHSLHCRPLCLHWLTHIWRSTQLRS